MDKSVNSEIKLQPKMLVMPLVPGTGQEYNGTGLGVHFFLGNIMAVHNMLSEFWFGWRVKKIFPEKELFQEYCQGKYTGFDKIKICREQGVKYLLSGSYQENENNINLSLELIDAQIGKSYSCNLKMNFNDQFKSFYDDFFDWLEKSDLPLSKEQKHKASWPETISIKGLQFLGNGLGALYLTYIDASDDIDSKIDLHWFEKCAATSSESFLAHDLLAWAMLKNKEYHLAKDSFQTSINYNPDGLGALAGLMWCAVFTSNRDEAYKYSLAKALVRNEDPAKAKAFVDKKFDN